MSATTTIRLQTKSFLLKKKKKKKRKEKKKKGNKKSSLTLNNDNNNRLHRIRNPHNIHDPREQLLHAARAIPTANLVVLRDRVVHRSRRGLQLRVRANQSHSHSQYQDASIMAIHLHIRRRANLSLRPLVYICPPRAVSGPRGTRRRRRALACGTDGRADEREGRCEEQAGVGGGGRCEGLACCADDGFCVSKVGGKDSAHPFYASYNIISYYLSLTLFFIATDSPFAQLHRERRSNRLRAPNRLDIRLHAGRIHPFPTSPRVRQRHRDPPRRLVLRALPQHANPDVDNLLSACRGGVCDHLEVGLGLPPCSPRGRVLHYRLLRACRGFDHLARRRQCGGRDEEELHGCRCLRGLLCWEYCRSSASSE